MPGTGEINQHSLTEADTCRLLCHAQHSWHGLQAAPRAGIGNPARLQWFWFRAGALGIAALVANLPMFFKDGGIAPKPWTFAVAAGALGLSWAELEDIRELRSEVKELERREQQWAEQIQSLKDGDAVWDSDPKLGGLGSNSKAKNDLDGGK